MTGWVILVDQPRDLPNAETPHKVISTSEYLARPRLFDMGRPKLVNLARSYAYQSKGYYASLLAEARGHRVVPTVETMLELREQKLYEHALPELEDELKSWLPFGAAVTLLEHLVRNAGQIVTRDELSAAAFARQASARIDRNVDTLVSKVRRKLDPKGDLEQRIKTVRNVGYLLALPVE